MIVSLVKALKSGKRVRQTDMISWTGIQNWTDEYAKKNLSTLAFNAYMSGKSSRLRAIRRAKGFSSDKLPYSEHASAIDCSLEGRIGYINKITCIQLLDQRVTALEKRLSQNESSANFEGDGPK